MQSLRRWWLGWHSREQQPGLPSLPFDVLTIIAGYCGEHKCMVALFSTCVQLWTRFAHTENEGLWRRCALAHYPVLGVSPEFVRDAFPDLDVIECAPPSSKKPAWKDLYMDCTQELLNFGALFGSVLFVTESSCIIYNRPFSWGQSWRLDCLSVPLQKRFKIITLFSFNEKKPPRCGASFFFPLLRGLFNVGAALGIGGMVGAWYVNNQALQPFYETLPEWSHNDIRQAKRDFLFHWGNGVFGLMPKAGSVGGVTVDDSGWISISRRVVTEEHNGYFAFDVHFSHNTALYTGIVHSKHWHQGLSAFDSEPGIFSMSRSPQIRVILWVEDKEK